MSTQNQQIFAHLQSGKALTTQSAVRLFNCYRLAARIHDLKSAGHQIKSEILQLKSGKRCAVYSL